MERNLFYFSLAFILFISQYSIAQNISEQFQPQQKITYKNPNRIKPVEQNFSQRKLKALTFKAFTFSDFNIHARQVINLKNGKTVSAEKFLEEVNIIEKKLNEFGYSLRDEKDEFVLSELNYSYSLLDKQKQDFDLTDKKYLLEKIKTSPCGLLTEEEFKKAISKEKPKEAWPANQSKSWSVMLGDDNFGFEINSKFNFNAEEKNSNLLINSASDVEIVLKIFDEKIQALKLIDRVFNKPYQNSINLFVFNNETIKDNLASGSRKNYYRDLNWFSGIEFSLGPFTLSGTIKTAGNVGVMKFFNPQQTKLNEELIPYVDLDFHGELSAGFTIAEAGIEGSLKLLNDTLTFVKNIELKNSSSESYFDLQANGVNKLIALKGKIYAYLKIDHLIGTKKYILVLYNNPIGVNSIVNFLKLNYMQPTKRDRELWLEINRINGITNFTARNENNVIPKSFIISVEAGGQSIVDTIADWNRDGIIETAVQFKIPLLSNINMPIKISVRERYKIGKSDFEAELDFMKGEEKEIQFCYNPKSRKIFGAVESEEEKEIIMTGDTNYFGERNHSIKFKLLPHMKINIAPSKTK